MFVTWFCFLFLLFSLGFHQLFFPASNETQEKSGISMHLSKSAKQKTYKTARYFAPKESKPTRTQQAPRDAAQRANPIHTDRGTLKTKTSHGERSKQIFNNYRQQPFCSETWCHKKVDSTTDSSEGNHHA